MKVLLVHPPCGPLTIGLRHLVKMEPLGLETVGAGVSSQHDVRLVDMMVREEDLADTLAEFKPDVAGVTSEMARTEPALDVLRAVRRAAPECVTVAGGHQPTMMPEEFNDPAVDLLVIGEGVEPFAQICATRAAGGTRFDHIRGLMIRTPNGLTPTEPRLLPPDINSQPLPDRSLTARYRRDYFYITEPSAAGVRIAYGCPYRCRFCPGWVYSGGYWVPRDAKLIFDDICTIREKFVYFYDENSFHDVARMTTLGNMLLAAGVKKRYHAYARADSILKHADMFELWARVGLSMVFIGVESLDAGTLLSWDKKITPSVNEQAIELLGKLGIDVAIGFMLRPDVSAADFQRFDDYIRDHPAILHVEFTPVTPCPGTPLYEEQKDQILSHNWQLYDMQHFVVKTVLPQEEIFRMVSRSYTKVAMRIIRRDGFKLFFTQWGGWKWRLIKGLFAQRRALARAHLDVSTAIKLDQGKPPRRHVACGVAAGDGQSAKSPTP
jgi:radical SAM superfamily enzyme YgiQ (UPF0313 family)